MAGIAGSPTADLMQTYINRREHEAAGDYSAPVLIRGRYYRINVPPVFEELRDTATVEAVYIDSATIEPTPQQD
jgi:hypothetical protein